MAIAGLRLFAKLAPKAFAAAFGRWLAGASEATELLPMAIDGKSVRGSKRATSTGCLHLVSEWATNARLTLGQVSVPDGSNEIAAVPALLEVFDLAAAVVTLDAAGCQKAIARQIRTQGRDFRAAVHGVLDGVGTTHADGLASLMTLNFQEFEDVSLLTA